MISIGRSARRDVPEAFPAGWRVPQPLLESVDRISRRVGWPNVALSLLLAGLGSWLVTQADNDGGPVWVVAILLIAFSLIVFRAAPAVAAGTSLAGIALGQLGSSSLVSCGVVLPVVAVMAFRLAARPGRRSSVLITVLALAGIVTIELLFDPVFDYAHQAQDPSGIVFVVAFVTGFGVAGSVARSRRRMLERLRAMTVELTRQRELTAAAAVAADRARVGVDLDPVVRLHLRRLAEATERGSRAAAGRDLEANRDALAEVEFQGREVLAGMRAVVGRLDRAATQPPPGIAQLEDLLRHATVAEVRVRTDGAPRPIGPHLDLSVYRIVEHLLAGLGQQPGDRVDLRLTYTSDAVVIQLGGDRAAGPVAEDRGGLEAAQARVHVAGGRLEVADRGLRRNVRVLLPTPAALAGTA